MVMDYRPKTPIVTAGIWTPLITLSPAGVSNIGTAVGALIAYDLFLVLIKITANIGLITMRFNGDSSALYNYRYLDSGTTVNNAVNQTSLLLGNISVNDRSMAGSLLMNGIGQVKVIAANLGTTVAIEDLLLNGYYVENNDITRMTFYAAGTDMNGSIKIYGMNF